MSPLKPVTLTTPDGVSRALRDTPGSRKLFFDRYGRSNFIEVAKERGDDILFEVAWLMMHDENGDPPQDLPLKRFLFGCSARARTEVFAAIMAAVSNGEQSKNELEALLTKAEKSLETPTGSDSGPSPSRPSDSATPSSGGDTPGTNSMPESSGTTSASGDSTTEPA